MYYLEMPPRFPNRLCNIDQRPIFWMDTTRARYLEQFHRKAITSGGISWTPRIGKELFISDMRVNEGFLPARQAVLNVLPLRSLINKRQPCLSHPKSEQLSLQKKITNGKDALV